MKSFITVFYLFFFVLITNAQTVPRIFINEFLASNISIDADILDFDDFSDWLEIYNDENTNIDLGGYYITDDPDNPCRWKIPDGTIISAKGFLRFWADGYDEQPGKTYQREYYPYDYFITRYYHLNFSLNRAGEYIGLYNPDGELVDSLYYDLQYRDISYGRQPDGVDNWYFFGEPTPASSNTSDGSVVTETAETPEISLASGFYSGLQTVSITTLSETAEIRYTMDGSAPGSASLLYENPIEISENTVFKAQVFESGKLPGEIVARSYFIDQTVNLPVISLSVDPYYMWDTQKGIYDHMYKERELPVYLEIYDESGQPGFGFNAGIRLTGQQSLLYDQKSFTIEADDRFGMDVINEQIFPQRKIDNYKALYLRNAGVPDNQSTFFRDALQHSLVINKIDIDCQAYLPYAVFINGDYWGIYNLRDKIDENYIAGIYNINPDDIDLLEYEGTPNPTVMEGNADNYNAFYDYIASHDLSLPENYNLIKSWMDIDEYINYQICEIYYNNVIWPAQNVRMWRERKENRKWRWILFDLDIGLGLDSPNGYMNNTLALAVSDGSSPQMPPAWATLIFRKLLANDEFKNLFIQRFATYINSVFYSNTVLSTIDSLRNTIDEEMVHHISRWKNASYGTPIPNHSAWLDNIEVMKNFARFRPNFQRQHILQYFNLEGTTHLNLGVQNSGAGSIKINEVFESPSGHGGLYFKNIPMIIEAVPEIGYKFIEWQGIADKISNPLTFMPAGDTLTITAVFGTETVNILPSRISGDTVFSKINSPYYALDNVWVDSNITVTIEQGVEIIMPEDKSIIIQGRILVEGVSQEPVVIKPNPNTDCWGALCFVNATHKSELNHLKIIGATKGIDFSRDRAAVSGYNSEILINGLIVEEVQAPVFARYGKITIKNSRLQSDYAGDLINVKNADSALVENCDLHGNDSFDSDAIDYDQLSGGIIRGNRIYNFYGYNSDGIDLGENSQNIFIEKNIIYNINDKGISIGKGSSAEIQRNLIVNCGQGMGIKDFDSYGYIVHNTFYGNEYGVACFVKNTGEGGGSADVVNCIFANSSICDYLVDALSSLNISFTMSDRFELPGFYNSIDTVDFLNNLRLKTGSPAIDKGNPALPADPDGSLPDLGAYPYNPIKQVNLLINEIHYHPAEGINYEFIEVVNAGSSSVNIGQLKLDGSVHYNFPADQIDQYEYFIVAKSALIYQSQGYKVYQWDSGILPDGAGELVLITDSGDTNDFVNYNSRFAWPREADGYGPSLELHHITMENMASDSWRSSYPAGGSPGESNHATLLEGLFINEFVAANSNTIQDEDGDYDDWIEIYNSNDFPVNLSGLYMTDNPDRPYKYRIPDYDLQKSSIPAKGFLLCWADDEIEQGVTHLSFKLDKDGEYIAIVQRKDDQAAFLDSVTFSEQKTDVSYGRYPDGSDNWRYSSVPTPLDSNQVPSAIKTEPVISDRFYLFQNYPNPFNNTTIINYQLPVTCNVELAIYNILGQKITTLVSQKQKPGGYAIQWNALGYASGVYFYRIKTDQGYVKTNKFILLK
ncbi:MAG: CotH kinase family protein [Calditrichaceae bacterium]|nr:CotH kinase family protein [Calditrichaceae bacterium]MBN2707709.1 CotH kinase family protein [Calditrichaceae bacterium]RQV96475.1 MAG: T9SS C-terminal target domain-containing protein [Calditrichota bacterium]